MNNTFPNTKVLLVPKRQAAQLLGISERTLHDLTKAGTIPHVRLGQRGVRYSPKSLETFIEGQLTASAR